MISHIDHLVRHSLRKGDSEMRPAREYSGIRMRVAGSMRSFAWRRDRAARSGG